MSDHQFTTNNALIPFQFENSAVPVIKDENGEPWWVLKDVCAVLELTDPSAVASQLRPHEVSTTTLSRTGQNVRLLLVNESGLYRIIMRSRKPAAERFQDWVCQEVIPQIRKTGKYAVPTATPYLILQETASRELLAALVVLDALQVPLHIAQQEAVKMIEGTTGVSFRAHLRLAPAQSNIQPEDEALEPTELAYKVGERSGIVMNRLLCEWGWQERDDGGGWLPTRTGAPFATRHAWTSGSKSGYNYRWNVKAVQKKRAEIRQN